MLHALTCGPKTIVGITDLLAQQVNICIAGHGTIKWAAVGITGVLQVVRYFHLLFMGGMLAFNS